MLYKYINKRGQAPFIKDVKFTKIRAQGCPLWDRPSFT